MKLFNSCILLLNVVALLNVVDGNSPSPCVSSSPSVASSTVVAPSSGNQSSVEIDALGSGCATALGSGSSVTEDADGNLIAADGEVLVTTQGGTAQVSLQSLATLSQSGEIESVSQILGQVIGVGDIEAGAQAIVVSASNNVAATAQAVSQILSDSATGSAAAETLAQAIATQGQGTVEAIAQGIAIAIDGASAQASGLAIAELSGAGAAVAVSQAIAEASGAGSVALSQSLAEAIATNGVAVGEAIAGAIALDGGVAQASAEAVALAVGANAEAAGEAVATICGAGFVEAAAAAIVEAVQIQSDEEKVICFIAQAIIRGDYRGPKSAIRQGDAVVAERVAKAICKVIEDGFLEAAAQAVAACSVIPGSAGQVFLVELEKCLCACLDTTAGCAVVFEVITNAITIGGDDVADALAPIQAACVAVETVGDVEVECGFRVNTRCLLPNVASCCVDNILSLEAGSACGGYTYAGVCAEDSTRVLIQPTGFGLACVCV